ncbi:unnamed protein product [Sphagnum balticum]
MVRRAGGCETWLLKNGGEGWVAVVKDKQKRKSDIAEALASPFPVLEKVAKDVTDLYDCKFKTEFFMQLHEAGLVGRVLKDETLGLAERLRFAAIGLEPLAQLREDLF